MLAIAASLLLVPFVLVMLVGIHHLTPPDRRWASQLAMVFAAVYAAIIAATIVAQLFDYYVLIFPGLVVWSFIFGPAMALIALRLHGEVTKPATTTDAAMATS